MVQSTLVRTILLWFAVMIFFPSAIFGQVDVLTNRNNLYRTGLNDRETILTASNVSTQSFGLIFSRAVDDEIYTQPLIVTGVSTPKGVRNLLIVATINNSIYAFNADDAADSTPIWQVNLTYDSANLHRYRPVRNSDILGACSNNYRDFNAGMGIVGTPVIDKNSLTIYLVARSIDTTNRRFVQYLHALDVKTGVEKPNSPRYITATVSGTGHASVNGVITFDQQLHNQRPALMLYDNVVYIEWASHCDYGPYHGWMIGYDATTLEQKYVYNDTKNGDWGGIWMSGQAPAVDSSGYIYISTGNGTTGNDANPNDTTNRGESLVKLSTSSGQLQPVDFFTPANYGYLNTYDLDYGCDGVFLLPGSHYSLSGSKEGYLYLIDNSKMGGTTTDNSNVVQMIDANVSAKKIRNLHGSPVYNYNSRGEEFIYIWGCGGALKQIPFKRSSMIFDTLNKRTASTEIPWNVPGGMLSVSSNSGKTGTGVVWATHLLYGSPDGNQGPAVLQAFDADDVTKELWNSNLNMRRDSLGRLSKFAPPTIANGKVYISTFSGRVNIYGLNPPVKNGCSDPVPYPWQHGDVGFQAIPGDACYRHQLYTLTASGNPADGTNDALHYLYQNLTGDFELKCRILSLAGNSPNARVGILLRKSLDAGSPEVFFSLKHDSSVLLQSRASTNGVIDSLKSINLNSTSGIWLRVTGVGNVYTCFSSEDGRSWVTLDSVVLSLGTNPYFGVALSGYDNTQLATALIAPIAFTGNSADGPLILNFSGENIENRFARLQWEVSDTTGIEQYQIERSEAHTQYSVLETLSADSITKPFSCVDLAPQDGTNFYRLKVVLRNGVLLESRAVAINFNFDQIELFPNPASTEVNFLANANFTQGQPITVEIVSASGQTVFENVMTTIDKTLLQIPLSSIQQKGFYVVTFINSQGKRQSHKLIIR